MLNETCKGKWEKGKQKKSYNLHLMNNSRIRPFGRLFRPQKKENKNTSAILRREESASPKPQKQRHKLNVSSVPHLERGKAKRQDKYNYNRYPKRTTRCQRINNMYEGCQKIDKASNSLVKCQVAAACHFPNIVLSKSPLCNLDDFLFPQNMEAERATYAFFE